MHFLVENKSSNTTVGMSFIISLVIWVFTGTGLVRYFLEVITNPVDSICFAFLCLLEILLKYQHDQFPVNLLLIQCWNIQHTKSFRYRLAKPNLAQLFWIFGFECSSLYLIRFFTFFFECYFVFVKYFGVIYNHYSS